ncbi:Nuclear anchorage protein 1 [Aphelenchoides besseyi]|nr:Nuclear anchorage protein 1 [Aphelenchoides besseyi]
MNEFLRFISSPLRSVSDEHEKIQKKTFTKWINYHLETPVNKTHFSKRVHHISNLTTVLNVLRGRGLELVNNNPTDLADGNPHIVLGLIWQIILHFQVETAIELLREWGLDGTAHGAGAMIVDEPATSSSKASSPTSSVASSFRMPKTPDRILRRWLATEIGGHYGISIEDMDRSWKDGVAFCALVHRCRPDLVDMDAVKRSTPRENLELAFNLANSHLGIRPLLDVEDMLCDRPDKRSVVTYVSQFLRPASGSGRNGAALPLKSREFYSVLIEWIEKTAADARLANPPTELPQEAQLTADFEWHDEIRRELLRNRVFFADLRRNSHVLLVDEWTKIEEK